ncbi:hypothetical protein [uncultured Tenacibaculum sp.]|uniref:hypothetical protein n=1 Tax=uncultured Tenacibaculum sp. TaxID=174713 RepID=UPI00260D05DB|nr:hypothetical protein [uncultured Tenacibaculum sp.]
MGFYGKEPVTQSECKVVYVWTGLGTPGFFSVYVQGEAQNYSYGFDLVRDPHFVGGLKVDVMGWTGPLGEGTTPYKVHGTFQGAFQEEIIISGSNGDFTVKVEEIPHDEVENYIKSKSLEEANY